MEDLILKSCFSFAMEVGHWCIPANLNCWHWCKVAPHSSCVSMASGDWGRRVCLRQRFPHEALD